MHLISHEAQGCITVRLRVFVSQHLPRTVTVSNPLKDIDVVSETLRSLLFQRRLQTRGLICLNPPHTAAAATLDEL